MPPYHFPGFPAFLDGAAREIGRPEAAVSARRDATLAAVATLCGQAATADPRHVAEILAEAEALGDRLRAALLASERMLAHVRAGRTPTEADAPRSPTPPNQPSRATRKHA